MQSEKRKKAGPKILRRVAHTQYVCDVMVNGARCGLVFDRDHNLTSHRKEKGEVTGGDRQSTKHN